jgi:hypothetical protein
MTQVGVARSVYSGGGVLVGDAVLVAVAVVVGSGTVDVMVGVAVYATSGLNDTDWR